MLRRACSAVALAFALCATWFAMPAAAVHGPLARTAIDGGRGAEAGTFPWLAFVFDRSGDTFGECAGTVIAPRLVLTAAHCLENTETGVPNDPTGYRVVTGDVNRNASDRQLLTVSEIRIDPLFDPEKAQFDAGLLVLNTPTSAASIALAQPGQPEEAGEEAAIAGWGRLYPGEKGPAPRRLQAAVSNVADPEMCSFFRNFDSAHELCIEGGAVAICDGDSGGPLITHDIDIGIASYGPRERDCEYPEVYTRVASIEPWVREQEASLPSEAAAAPLVDIPAEYESHRGPFVAGLVPEDGEHFQVTYLLVTLHCAHGYIVTPRVEYSGSPLFPIVNRVAAGTLLLPSTRQFRRGTLNLKLRFDELGEAEGEINASYPSRSRKAKVCGARNLRFTIDLFRH